jgi:hypothetical protein
MKTPITRASPTPTGNATAIPAIEVAAVKRIFEALKITPPKNALNTLENLTCAISLIKGLPPDPILPIVKAIRIENKSIPIA